MRQDETNHWSVGFAQVRSRLFPPPRNRAVPWGGVEVLVILAGFGIALPVLCLALATRTFRLEANDQLVFGFAIATGFITILGTPLVLRAMCGARLYQLGLHCSGLSRNVMLGLLTYCLAAPLVFAIMALAIQAFEPTEHQIEKILRRSPTVGYFFAATVCAVVIAPLQEEMIFRGVLMPWLRRLFGPRSAIALSALIFALLHSDAWPAPIPLFILALFLGYLAHHTNSLIAPITLHATFNAVSMVMLVIMVHTPEALAGISTPQPSRLTTLWYATSIVFAW